MARVHEEAARARDEAERAARQLATLLAQAEADKKALAEVTLERDTIKARVDELERDTQLMKLRLGRKSLRFAPSKEQGAFDFKLEVQAPARAPVAQDRELAPDASQAETTDDVAPATAAEHRPRQRGAPKRRPRDAFADLPSRTVVCPADPAAACAGCGRTLRIVGKAESFRIGWVPGHFVREDVVRDKCTCDHCPDQGVLTVPAPYALDRTLCADSLLARVLVDKFADHLPLNRQASRMARDGFHVTSGTLASWVLAAAPLLGVLAKAIQADLHASSFLQADDTGFPVQDGDDGALRQGRMWAYTDQQQVVYHFTDTKQGIFPAEALAGFKGDCLLVDGGSEFNLASADLQRAGCWSHFRTYFCDALPFHPEEASTAMGVFRDLFMLERRWKHLDADARLVMRTQHSAPLVDSLMKWVKALSRDVRPKSKLGDAIRYGINQEPRLRLCLQRGDIPIHNNLSELVLRQEVIGRKNWLFARCEGGAVASAAAYTVIGSCKLQGIVPFEYLIDVLPRIQDHPARRVQELTPRAWSLARSAPAVVG